MNMFNNGGQLNASSFKDSLQQLIKFASILEDNVPSNQGLAGQPSLSDDKRDELISRAILCKTAKSHWPKPWLIRLDAI